MADDELGPGNRRAARRRRLGFEGACACGEDDPAALRRSSGRTICAHCLAVEQGRSPNERHHVLGRANGPESVNMDVNDHDRRTDRELDWPPDTRRNPRRSPHRRKAAALRATVDEHRTLEPILLGIAEYFESLDKPDDIP